MMLTVRRPLALVGLVAGITLLSGPSPAQAKFTLTLSQGNLKPLVVADATTTSASGGDTTTSASGGDLDLRAGVIVYSGSYGGFGIQLSMSTSNSGQAVLPAILTINNTSISSTTGGTLTVTVEDDHFTVPLSGRPVDLQSQLSTTQLPTGSQITLTSYLDGNPGTPILLTTVGGSLVSDSVTIGSNPYTLRSVTTFTLSGAGMVQFTGNTAVALPEPGTLVMGLLAVPLLGVGYRLRRRPR